MNIIWILLRKTTELKITRYNDLHIYIHVAFISPLFKSLDIWNHVSLLQRNTILLRWDTTRSFRSIIIRFIYGRQSTAPNLKSLQYKMEERVSCFEVFRCKRNKNLDELYIENFLFIYRENVNLKVSPRNLNLDHCWNSIIPKYFSKLG